ncbi:MAG: hypothetical protein VYD22_04645, partial [Gemmatimonadota bacterium]|nr:hypothetical protein [Gemmatimonadota bacterium]
LASSLDEDRLIVMERTNDRGWDLLVTREVGDSLVFEEYLRADWDEMMATISPDGEMVAYVSNESGNTVVYVRRFPGAEGRVRVSDDGGTEPQWAPDGSAVYYRNGSSLMRAVVRRGESFSVDASEEVVSGVWSRVPPAFPPPRTNWDISPDGDSFIFVSQPGATGNEGNGSPVISLEVVVNWFEELRSRIGN